MDDSTTLFDRAWDESEDVIARFEEAWTSGARPEIVAYLSPGVGRTRLLTELVHIDLEYRHRGGEPARVEEYLARFPELGGDRAVVLALIAAEHELRRRREPGLAITEFFQRFPEYRAELPGQIARATTLDGDVPLRPTDQRAEALPEVAGYEILGFLGVGVRVVTEQAGHQRGCRGALSGPCQGGLEIVGHLERDEVVRRLPAVAAPAWKMA
jgi:hypothetical protein